MGVDKTYEKALEVLRKNSTSRGFLATCEMKNNYKRVWSRDGVVQGIASILSEKKDLVKIFRQNLNSLKDYQDETGRIPSNINFETGQVSYGTFVGKIDATLWYVIGVGEYYKYTKDKSFLKKFISSVTKAMDYLLCLELNGKGLLYIPTGGDWADEYITEGYVLFDQILYYIALRECELMLRDLGRGEEGERVNQKANFLEEQISVNYFPSASEKNKRAIYNSKLYSKIAKRFNKDYALSCFSSNGFNNYLDCFANSLILLFEVCSLSKRRKILNTLNKRLSLQKLKILPAFWPPVTKKDKTYWNVLKMNSLFEFRNKPHYYHNGGLWPLIQGFFISGVMSSGSRTIAKSYLTSFSEIIEKEKYKFHEFFESKGYTPQGVSGLGFSAAGYIIAYNSVIKNKKIFL